MIKRHDVEISRKRTREGVNGRGHGQNEVVACREGIRELRLLTTMVNKTLVERKYMNLILLRVQLYVWEMVIIRCKL